MTHDISDTMFELNMNNQRFHAFNKTTDVHDAKQE